MEKVIGEGISNPATSALRTVDGYDRDLQLQGIIDYIEIIRTLTIWSASCSMACCYSR